MKMCCRCKVEKPFSSFSLDKGKKDGRSSSCKPCSSEYGKAWARANIDRLRRVTAAWRKANKDRIKQRNREKFYGTDGSQLLENQNGHCAICMADLMAMPDKHRHIDHDHATGEVRGWLCHWCNLGLGKFKDNPELLRKAADYLEVRKMI